MKAATVLPKRPSNQSDLAVYSLRKVYMSLSSHSDLYDVKALTQESHHGHNSPAIGILSFRMPMASVVVN